MPPVSIRLTYRLIGLLGDRAVVRVQGPIRLGPDSEPQPDMVLLRPPVTRYQDHHPDPADVFLVIEVGDATAEDDRTRKIALYARVGIAESWLVNHPGEAIQVYRDPAQDGYRDVRTVQRGQSVAPHAFPDVSLTVDEILG